MSRSMIKQQNSGATAHVVLYTPRQSTMRIHLSNSECSPFELFYPFRGVALLYVGLHVCSLRHVDLYECKLKCSVPRIITDRYA